MLAALFLTACSPANPTAPSSPRGDSRPIPWLSRTRFLAFGDSVTAGTTSPGLATRMSVGLPQSYPAKLLGLMTTRYPDQGFLVENAGRPGERADAAMGRLNDMIRLITPDAVIILHGANDIFTDNIAGVPRAVAALQSLVRAAKRTEATVLLCTLLPQRAGGQRAANPAALSELNRGIREITRTEGIVLVDLALSFDSSLIGTDGLHPTELGYTRLAELMLASLRAEFEQPPALH